MNVGAKTLQKKGSWLGYGTAVAALHAAGIASLAAVVPAHPTLLGLGLLAYTLGVRHAFDADHIAAIDNTVRKLLQQGRNPRGVGFFFSVGHSTVVCLMAVVTALAAGWAIRAMPSLQAVGGVIGTAVSGGFLLVLGVVNLMILIQILQVFFRMRTGVNEEGRLEELLHARGLIARLVTPLLRFVGRSWHVYPIGFLFGLGFDTASEVSLMALSAGAGQSGLPVVGVLALPLLFAAGMSLFDTADGIFMSEAYTWAFRNPVRKIYYNLTVTGLAAAAALLIGSVELVQVVASHLRTTSGFWTRIQELDLGSVGYVLVVLFGLAWALSYGAWKVFRIEERWALPQDKARD
ncbi:HoxN/HupN/NixA family nickel/cobalt transporter [Kyrpidia spormannii]|uniref:High-affinity nickel-transport protein, NixA n=2 Tax=Kyrpidia spormannii TaxID=2055160 RepID=A0ACA8Z9J0_9BACL|nr:HoxN/HupN/NixA family nickel/cobalt transporter [Kyrpidia spormannii]CAB3391579.1 High-affinity nickel-transport protein, NixA [Kyrpidia spormannii]CAB3392493.1 High-affinity nickel-transport protein NixA [Kyrpidia spormannii]